jgi:hypothetical protein
MRDTIEMAREAGWTSYDSQDERFKAFAALVRADEREACAKIADEWGNKNLTAVTIAEEIRARGNT